MSTQEYIYSRDLKEKKYDFVRLRIWGRLAYCSQVRNRLPVSLDFVDNAENLYTEDLPPAQQIELLSRIY